jgi:hypothetical protein
MIKAIKNLVWLVKPCWKYGKLYVVTHILSMSPIGSQQYATRTGSS